MSSEAVIKVENLSKKYVLGRRGTGTEGLRHALHNFVTAPWRRLERNNSKLPPEVKTESNRKSAGKVSPRSHNEEDLSLAADEFYALKDVSFEIRRGEVVGIIGRNGAGKSTLLKILSRITEPTEGRVGIKGRVASLLEVGTGFHPELTGRENIFLNGAILGMTRDEIRKRFDEIVSFAEIEKFLDTPVKRYSSGMYVRLAFAVAAHLDPEILVVDEVLAVGDAQFQRKCLGKMQDVSTEQGRTVLFVSHNMTTVLNLCSRGIWLQGGHVQGDSSSQEIVQAYMQSGLAQGSMNINGRLDRKGDGTVRIQEIKIKSFDSDEIIRSSSKLEVQITYSSSYPVSNPKILTSFNDVTGVGIYGLDSEAAGGLPEVLPSHGTIICCTESINLTPSRYFINIAFFGSHGMSDYVTEAAFFDVEADDFFGTGKSLSHDWVLGLLPHQWNLR
jgi:lipopolysaccharide transport system ATP-binding protein